MIRPVQRRGTMAFVLATTLSVVSCDVDRVVMPTPVASTPAAIASVAADLPTACPAGATKWAAAVNGSWLIASNWTAGVPTAATPACIDLPGAYIVTVQAASVATVVPAQSLFLGVPGAALQPTLRLTQGTLVAGTDITVHGKFEMSPGVGAIVRASGTYGVAVTGSLVGSNSAVKTVEAAAIENDGAISVNSEGGIVLRALTIVNRGSIVVATFRLLAVRAPTSGGTPAVTLAGGTVDVFGTLLQETGTLLVTGGVVNGVIDLTKVDELRLEHDNGGRFDIAPLGGSVPTTVTRLAGTIGPNQHVWMGLNHLTVETPGLVNRGQLTVAHTGSLGRTVTTLRTVDGGTLLNENTLTLQSSANSAPILVGAITNAAGGLIANAGGNAIIKPSPFTNLGTVRVPQFTTMSVFAETNGPAPEMITQDGTLELSGTYTQTAGEFRWYNGTVSGAGPSSFSGVRFSGFGTWARALALTGASILAPGASPGRIAITGDYTPSSTTATDIELAGSAPGTGHDQIVVANTARFAGPLRVVLADGFVPLPCQTFDVVTYAARTGTFTNATTPIDIGGGMKLRQVYTATRLVLVAYNADGPNVSPTQVEVSVDGQTATYDVCIGAGADVITVLPDANVLVDKPTLTFAGSQLPQTVTVSASPAAVSATGLIRHTAASGIPVASVTVTINGFVPPDSDPPLTTAAGSPLANANGWNSTDVTVSLAAADAGSGVADIVWSLSGAQAGGATASGSSASVTITAEGITTLTYFARDVAGNQEAPRTLTVRVDKTAPSVAGTRDPSPNVNGWNNTDVTATFTATDEGSGVDGLANAEVAFTEDGANQSATRTFRDRAGNEASATVSGISIDKTPPTVTVTRQPPPNPDGWNNTDVTATFTATDALSGIDGPATLDVAFTENGANQSATRTFADRAGNQASATITGVFIDKTPPPPPPTLPPTISCSATPNEIWPPNGKLVPVTITVNVTGAASWILERVSSSEPALDNIVDFVVGTPDTNGQLRAARSGAGTGRVYTFEYRAVNAAGVSSSGSCEVRVLHDQGRSKR